MAVGVRFHDRNQFAGGSQFTQTLQVVSQSAAVNDYSCRLHLYSFIKESSKSFVLLEGDKPENPRELSKLSDRDERA
ncbi:hypothetical protein TUM12147_40060 [Citrobacter europaeus]|nr:hypothetical protein TUM12147_40060 [Citrobacter europaeus]GIZ24956.1 hypothetical protein TUM12148_36200 [Citrobacter europaeus]